MKVQTAMTKQPVYIKENEFVTHARQLMRDRHLRTLPVVNGNNKVRGIFTEKDLLNISTTKSNVTIGGFVTEAPVVTPDTELYEAARLMLKTQIGRVPVVQSHQDSTLVGILSIVDIFHNLDLERIPHKHVAEIMTTKVVTCSPKDPIAKVWQNMRQLGFSGIPVISENKLIGMVTRRNIIKAGYARIGFEDERGTRITTSPHVEKVMSTPPYTISPSADINEAIIMLMRLDIGRISVAEDEKLLGIVDRYDLVKACLED